MPRSYGRTATSIWRDKDFRDLASESRFVYVMLFNQPDIAACGVLGLFVTRWAGNTGYTLETMRAALDELEKRDYIVVDADAEEVFIRSFIKWDGGANNDLRRKAIRDSSAAVASDKIRASIAPQLDRIGLVHSLSVAPLGPIETASDTRRVVVTTGDYENNPQPATTNREPEPQPGRGEPPGYAAPPSMFCSKHPDGTEEPCGPCATARTRYAQHVQNTAGREAEAKQARAAAVVACPDCDERGMQLDPETRKPTSRCSHPTLDRATGTPQ